MEKIAEESKGAIMKEVGVGVIGLGFIGSKHAEVFANSSNAKLVAVSDTNTELLNTFAEKFGCLQYHDYTELLDRSDIDIVSICLPENAHVIASEEAAKRNKHVLLEKPLALTLEECDKIISAFQKSHTKLMVGHLLRFDTKYSQAYKYVKEGGIGEVVLIRAQRNGMISAGRRSGKYASVAFHVGIHDVDLALWFADSPPSYVFAAKTEKLLKTVGVEDSIASTIVHKDGSISTVGSTWVLPDSLGSGVNASFEVFGTKGFVSVDIGVERGLRMFSENDGWQYPDIWHWPKEMNGLGGCLKAEIDHFVHCVINDKEPLITASDARKAVAVTLAALESAKSSNKVIL